VQQSLQQLLGQSAGPLTQQEILERWPSDRPPPANSLWRSLARAYESGQLHAAERGRNRNRFGLRRSDQDCWGRLLVRGALTYPSIPDLILLGRLGELSIFRMAPFSGPFSKRRLDCILCISDRMITWGDKYQSEMQHSTKGFGLAPANALVFYSGFREQHWEIVTATHKKAINENLTELDEISKWYSNNLTVFEQAKNNNEPAGVAVF
jgi:hypothetical protein